MSFRERAAKKPSKDVCNGMLLIIFSTILLTLIGLSGCADTPPPNKKQVAHMERIKVLHEERSQLDDIRLSGKDEKGRLAPEDIENKFKIADDRLYELLNDSSIKAIKWNARVRYVKRKGRDIVIHSSWGDQRYTLIIFDEDSKIIAENIIQDDYIKFSGTLGKEQSITLLGSRIFQEYKFYPKRVVTNYGEIIQEESDIQERNSRAKAVAKQKEEQEEKEADNRDIKNRIIELCKNEVQSNLKYPASASFSWLNQNFEHIAENKWVYYSVVEAKNGLGGAIPHRFKCEATAHGDLIEIVTQLLD